MVSELLYSGKSLSEIAGYTTVQLVNVVLRPRSKFGELLRDDGTPQFVRDNTDSEGQWSINGGSSFTGMFQQVKRLQGQTQDQIKQSWRDFLSRESPAALAAQDQPPLVIAPGWQGSHWVRGM